MKARTSFVKFPQWMLTCLLVVAVLSLFSWSATSAHSPVDSQSGGNIAGQASGPLSGVPCIAGFAGPFPCKNVDLMAYLPMNVLAGSSTADIWGWTDPQTGKEYALLSHGNATSFIDVSDPANPVILGELPAPVPNVLWRDIEVYGNHVYVVGRLCGRGWGFCPTTRPANLRPDTIA